MMTTPNTILVSVRLPDAMLMRLRERAERDGITQSHVMRRAIAAYLDPQAPAPRVGTRNKVRGWIT